MRRIEDRATSPCEESLPSGGEEAVDETHPEVECVVAFEARNASERHARAACEVASGARHTLRVPGNPGERQVVSRPPKAAGKKDDVVTTLAFVIVGD